LDDPIITAAPIAAAARAVASPVPELPPMMATRWLVRVMASPSSSGNDSLRHQYSNDDPMSHHC
jgi:hypothetical protein